jgi:hypothetical protein
MRKLVPLLVCAIAATAAAATGRIPGLRRPVVCPVLTSSNASFGFAGPVTGCNGSNSVPCNNSEAVAFAVTLPSPNSACGSETVTWNFGDGTTASGTAVTHVFQNAAQFTVTVTIASSRQTFPLSAAVSVVLATPQNRILNGTFNTDLSHWGFDFSLNGGQGVGDATWFALDEAGLTTSGSMLLRNTAAGRSYQQVQCVALNPGEQYVFGGDARYDGDAQGGALFAVAEFGTTDCTGVIGSVPSVPVAFAARQKWTHAQSSSVASSATHSGYLFLAAGKTSATGSLYEAWFDNVFVRGTQ